MPAEELVQKQLAGVFPLLLLSKGGATREVLDQTVSHLELEKKFEVLAITRLIAAMVFTDNEDKVWIERKFRGMEEFFESSPWYQEIVSKGESLGREEGIRGSIETVVQTRFPALAELTKERLEYISDQGMLQQVLVAMSAAQSEQKARRYLLALQRNA